MKNKKGFTLIELLAVIVILGLLMAIAIPSVTKYITESRKKTVVSTIGNYMSALSNDVNDLTYTFTESNTIYAVPIECIALERGGTNPFGAWHQANDAYWAYVLVQYDDETSSYRYGYTFKDSAGYGLYPTTQAKLNEQGKQIQTGLDLIRPMSGKITTITNVSNWNGFNIDSMTDLIVLESSSEGEIGNGKSTCTLQQKGDNYVQVEADKIKDVSTPVVFGVPYESIVNGVNNSIIFYEDGSAKKYFGCDLDATLPAGTYDYFGDLIEFDMGSISFIEFIVSEDKKSIKSDTSDELVYTLNSSSSWCVDKHEELPMLRSANSSIAFWQYSNKIKTITFQDSINIPSGIPNDHQWDVTKSQTGKVMAYITPNSSDSSFYDLYIQGDGKLYAPENSYGLFSMFEYVDYINNIELLDTSKVVNMSYMFNSFGYYSSVLKLDLGDNFDTSNVTDMSRMFGWTGYKSKVFTLNLGDKFDTSNVVNMSSMFWLTGYESEVLTLDLGNKFNTIRVKDMDLMFYHTGYRSKVFTLDLGDNFDTRNVTSMKMMFEYTGWQNPQFELDLGTKFNTSKVVNMENMFYYTGYKSSNFSLDCSSWNVDKVEKHDKFNYGVTSKVISPQWKK